MDTDTNTAPMELDVLETKVIKSDNVSPNSSRRDSLSYNNSEDVMKADQDEISTDSDDNNAEIVQRFSVRQPIKPYQYNFVVQLDPSLSMSSQQRITILKKKIRDLRKTYNMFKTELARIDRRQRKLRASRKKE